MRDAGEGLMSLLTITIIVLVALFLVTNGLAPYH